MPSHIPLLPLMGLLGVLRLTADVRPTTGSLNSKFYVCYSDYCALTLYLL